MVHLIYNQIGRRLGHRPLVAPPPLRVGLLQGDDGSTPPVHPYRLGKDTRSLSAPYVESIKASLEVAFYLSPPASIAPSHLDSLECLAAQAILIES